jgi:hypothetical protein
MDLPIIGAITGVSILAVAVTVGTVAMAHTMPEPARAKTIVMAPPLQSDSRSEVDTFRGQQPASLSPTDSGADYSVPTPTQLAPMLDWFGDITAPAPAQTRPATVRPMLRTKRNALTTVRPTRRPTHWASSDAPKMMMVVGLGI